MHHLTSNLNTGDGKVLLAVRVDPGARLVHGTKQSTRQTAYRSVKPFLQDSRRSPSLIGSLVGAYIGDRRQQHRVLHAAHVV